MLQDSLKKLVNHETLSANEAKSSFGDILSASCNKDDIASFLLNLREKGLTSQELGGCLNAYKQAQKTIKPLRSNILHMSVFEYEHATTVHVLLASAFVIAGAGIPVSFIVKRIRALHGTVYETLEKLGISSEISPEQVEKCISDIGMAFVSPQKFFEPSDELDAVLYSLRGETVLDIATYLTNPTPAKHFLVGVSNPDIIELCAKAYAETDAVRAMAIRGEDGIAGLTTTTTNRVCEHDSEGTYFISNKEVRLKQENQEDMRVSSSEENAEKIMDVLENKVSAIKDAVLFNAAAGLMVVGVAKNWQDGISKAQKSLKMGRALSKFKNIRNWTKNAINS